jgi:1-acyl-sn-glycerol-3-phosphate acyltransferase
MADTPSSPPPSAEEIERMFRHPAVVTARPLLRTTVEILKLVRRFDWDHEGREILDRLEPPVVLASNHMSHADTPAILSALPRSMRRRTAVAAALDVFGQDDSEHSSLGKRLLPLTVAAGFHAFAFDRHGSPLRSVRTAVQLIRHGWNLLLYPEGTRSRDGAMGPFKAGIGVISRFTDCPVVPIHVCGGRDILPCGRFMPGPGHIHVRFGEPMRLDEGETAEAFTLRLQERVQRLAPPAPTRAGSSRRLVAHGSS